MLSQMTQRRLKNRRQSSENCESLSQMTHPRPAPPSKSTTLPCRPRTKSSVMTTNLMMIQILNQRSVTRKLWKLPSARTRKAGQRFSGSSYVLSSAESLKPYPRRYCAGLPKSLARRLNGNGLSSYGRTSTGSTRLYKRRNNSGHKSCRFVQSRRANGKETIPQQGRSSQAS